MSTTGFKNTELKKKKTEEKIFKIIFGRVLHSPNRWTNLQTDFSELSNLMPASF